MAHDPFANDRSIAMRARLAAVGINLDEPKPDARTRAEPKAASSGPDRDRVRAILVERGALEKDLEWLTASCPSVEAALAYTVPRFPERAPRVGFRKRVTNPDPIPVDCQTVTVDYEKGDQDV